MQVICAEWGGSGLCSFDVPQVTNVMKEWINGKRKQATEDGEQQTHEPIMNFFYEQNHKILLQRGSPPLSPVTQLRDAVCPQAHKVLVQ